MNLIFFAYVCLVSASVFANNQLLVLSGGNSPSGNHYSQYLQTNTIYSDLKERLDYPVSVLFAAGNNETSKTAFADVHKTEKESSPSGLLNYDKYIYGVITGNRPATKTNVISYFNKDVKPKLNNFFLIVTDHGMPFYNSEGQPDLTYSNNCIDLWNIKLENNQIQDIGNFEQARCLSQKELNVLLRQKVQAKNRVFAMSQCFSGGFHQMAVNMTQGHPSINTGICGFTAITEDTIASGCSPDVDGPSYQGYERSFTEQLTGIDYVNKKRLRPGKKSFKDAHEAAVLEDLTVDIPLSTSDYYLWKWSSLLGSHIAFEMGANYLSKVSSAEFDSKLQLTKKMEAAVKVKFPELTSAVNASIKKLEQHVKQLENKMAEQEAAGETLFAQFEKLYYELAYSVWIDQLISGKSMNLTIEELQTEKFIVQLENSTGSSGPRVLTRQILPIMWSQDPARARSTSIYISERQNKILDYIASQGDQELKNQVQAMKTLEQNGNLAYENLDVLSKQHGLLRRLLIYRQVLGSWVVLNLNVNVTALSDLQSTLECEQTPLF